MGAWRIGLGRRLEGLWTVRQKGRWMASWILRWPAQQQQAWVTSENKACFGLERSFCLPKPKGKTDMDAYSLTRTRPIPGLSVMILYFHSLSLPYMLTYVPLTPSAAAYPYPAFSLCVWCMV